LNRNNGISGASSIWFRRNIPCTTISEFLSTYVIGRLRDTITGTIPKILMKDILILSIYYNSELAGE
jgi:hypothetical protein